MRTPSPGTRPRGAESFARYEFKYVLNQRRREEVEKEVEHFMSYDGFAHLELDNCYRVRSLYFENASATNYYEKIDGIKSRRKYRLRTYEETRRPEIPVFLEEKGRHNERTYKRRVRMEPEDEDIVLDPRRGGELLTRYPNNELVETFVFDCLRRQLSPVVLVDYVRRPYTSAFDRNFRVTFDSKLTAAATNELFPDQHCTQLQSMPGYTILEVKFDRRIPAWFHRLIQAYDMRRVSVSKFCKGMERCGLAVDLS